MWQLPAIIKPIVRPLAAWLLLVVFTISVTPKRYLHDLFACHQDSIAQGKTDSATRVAPQTLHCDCDQLVATSPFTDHHADIRLMASPVYSSLQGHYLASLFSTAHSFFRLRGPPVLS